MFSLAVFFIGGVAEAFSKQVSVVVYVVVIVVEFIGAIVVCNIVGVAPPNMIMLTVVLNSFGNPLPAWVCAIAVEVYGGGRGVAEMCKEILKTYARGLLGIIVFYIMMNGTT